MDDYWDIWYHRHDTNEHCLLYNKIHYVELSIIANTIAEQYEPHLIYPLPNFKFIGRHVPIFRTPIFSLIAFKWTPAQCECKYNREQHCQSIISDLYQHINALKPNQIMKYVITNVWCHSIDSWDQQLICLIHEGLRDLPYNVFMTMRFRPDEKIILVDMIHSETQPHTV